MTLYFNSFYLWDIFPIICCLLMHHRNFKQEKQDDYVQEGGYGGVTETEDTESLNGDSVAKSELLDRVKTPT